mgnify:CR=1 FL=1
MTERTDFRFFAHGYYGYFCKMCRKPDTGYASYRDLRRHQFEEPDSCMRRHLAVDVIHEVDPPFGGAPSPVPFRLPAPDELIEHRDEEGRLRVRGMLTGYRHWAVGRVGGRFRLFPVFQVRRAPAPYARGVTTARCAAEDPAGPHRAPDAGCSCGFYAFWTPQDASNHRGPVKHATILGRIDAWGKVLPGISGFRSENVMVAALAPPACTAPGCDVPSTSFVTRPHWTEWMTPGGRTYPRINDRRHTTYRDGADFVASIPHTDYLGWFCDAHSNGAPIAPKYANLRCNYPRESDGRPCARPSTFTLQGLPYSWCHEHAPLVFGADVVMEGLCDSYDVDAQILGSPRVEDPISPGAPGSPPS